MNHKSSIINLKSYINEFSFASPDWSKLPVDFPACDTSGLTGIEKTLFNGIKLAWYGTHPAGIRTLYYHSAKTGLGLMAIFLILISIFRLLTFSPTENLVKPVRAATDTVNGIIESTMSAILR